MNELFLLTCVLSSSTTDPVHSPPSLVFPSTHPGRTPTIHTHPRSQLRPPTTHSLRSDPAHTNLAISSMWLTSFIASSSFCSSVMPDIGSGRSSSQRPVIGLILKSSLHRRSQHQEVRKFTSTVNGWWPRGTHVTSHGQKTQCELYSCATQEMCHIHAYLH